MFEGTIFGVPAFMVFMLWVIIMQQRRNNEQNTPAQAAPPHVVPSGATSGPRPGSTGTSSEQMFLAASGDSRGMDRLAKVYVRQGDLRLAEMWWRRALAAAHEAGDRYMEANISNALAAVVLIPGGRLDEARGLLVDALSLDAEAQESGKATFNLGVAEFGSGNYEAARGWLTRDEIQSCDNPDAANYFLGLVSEQSGDLAQARQLWKSVDYDYAKKASKALVRTWEPQEEDAALIAVLGAVDRDSLSKSEAKTLKAAHKYLAMSDPKEAAGQARALANSLKDRGRLDDARQIYRGLMGIDAGYVGDEAALARVVLGVLECDAGNFAEARTLLEESLTVLGVSGRELAELHLGHACEAAGDLDQARECWSRAATNRYFSDEAQEALRRTLPQVS